MSAVDVNHILPFAISLLAVAVIVWRNRGQQSIKPGRLWLAPMLATLGIGMGLYFQPHPAFGIAQFAAMAAAAMAGSAVGMARARTLRLSRDPETGVVVAQASPLAILMLVVLLGARMALRSNAGPLIPGHVPALWPATAVDASMLFALAMIVTQRAALWRRIARL